ncbi:MAG: tetratricopeptide repeat protein [Psychroflexus halocasei]
MSKTGFVEKGRNAFLKELELEPNNPSTLSNLGLNYYLTKDFDIAIEYYKKSYRYSDSTYHVAAVNLGLTYYYNKDFNKGIAITDYVINQADDDDVLSVAYVHRALNYIGEERCDEAKADLDFIIDNFQSVNNIYYHIKDLTNNCGASWFNKLF